MAPSSRAHLPEAEWGQRSLLKMPMGSSPYRSVERNVGVPCQKWFLGINQHEMDSLEVNGNSLLCGLR